MFSCGVAEKKITPDIGLPIPGYFGDRRNVGISDDLYVRAFVFENCGRTVILISVDILDFQSSLSDEIRQRIQNEIGVPKEQIMVSATHIHTGGPTNYTGFECPCDETYIRKLADCAVWAARSAYGKRKAAKLTFAKGNGPAIGFNRNYVMTDGTVRTNPGIGNRDIVRPLSEIDRSLTLFCIEADCNLIGIGVNFACHPDTYGADEISADYPGVLSRLLKDRYGSDVVVLFLNGCAGNINHVDAIHGSILYCRENMERMGAQLAIHTVDLMDRLSPVAETGVSGASEILSMRRRQPTSEEYRSAKQILKNAGADSETRILAEEIIRLTEHPITDAAFEVQVLRIGDLFVVGLPCEAYSSIGVSLKNQFPKDNIVISELSNGTVGYVVPKAEFFDTLYESKLTEYNSFLPAEAADKMITAASELIARLKAENV